MLRDKELDISPVGVCTCVKPAGDDAQTNWTTAVPRKTGNTTESEPTLTFIGKLYTYPASRATVGIAVVKV